MYSAPLWLHKLIISITTTQELTEVIIEQITEKFTKKKYKTHYGNSRITPATQKVKYKNTKQKGNTEQKLNLKSHRGLNDDCLHFMVSLLSIVSREAMIIPRRYKGRLHRWKWELAFHGVHDLLRRLRRCRGSWLTGHPLKQREMLSQVGLR